MCGHTALQPVHRAHQVHLHHGAEIGDVHLREGLVAQDSRVVDEDIDPAPGVDGLLHHGLHRGKVGHRGAVGQGFAPGGADLVHHRLRRRDRAARAVHRAPEVVDHHPGPAGGQGQRMLTSQAAAGAGHDGHAAVELNAHLAFSKAVIGNGHIVPLRGCTGRPACDRFGGSGVADASLGRPSRARHTHTPNPASGGR
jgi:hypothetical protein